VNRRWGAILPLILLLGSPWRNLKRRERFQGSEQAKGELFTQPLGLTAPKNRRWKTMLSAEQASMGRKRSFIHLLQQLLMAEGRGMMPICIYRKLIKFLSYLFLVPKIYSGSKFNACEIYSFQLKPLYKNLGYYIVIIKF